ncbi:MAG: helix-turn-helix transcriptional regulator, partial [Bacteroidales bacterium]|nr:helix-turn-helix transcriptional regulator [Bacteroidales bacterium]
DFIKLCRLKKAAQLLGEGGRPVSEVATAVGFSSTSYFSKCFTAQFGVSPKDYLRS